MINKLDKEILELYKKIAEKTDWADTAAAYLATAIKYNPETNTFVVSEENYKENYQMWYKIFKK